VTAGPGRDDRAAVWPRRLRRIVVGLLVVLLVLAALYVVVRPFRVAVLTLALVPELLEGTPRPLSLITPDPVRIETTYGSDRIDRMDVYVPGTAPADFGPQDRYPALMLILGVSPLPLEDERVVAAATAFSRLGFVVGVPASSEMVERRLRPDEPAHLAEAFETIAGRTDVDPARIGLVAFSAGGGVALLAAAEPRIADRILFVNAFGSYGDLPDLLVEFSTRRVIVDGEERRWQPATLTREVFLQIILDSIEDDDAREAVRARVEPIILGDEGPTEASWDAAFAETLDGAPDAQAIYRMVTTPDRAVAREALEDLPPERLDELDALSPNRHVDRVRTAVHLMHDTDDDLIPFSQLGPLVAAVPDDRLEQVSTFSFFDHVTPGGLDPAALGELWGLYRHILEVLDEAL
jgi:pimeloyl-ACP methyl ester carboxylesterase